MFRALPIDWPASATPPELDPEQQNAYQILTELLNQWGLSSLSPEVLRLLQEGYSQQQIGFLLQDTEAYRTRFYGNELRRQKGLAVLSPAEYLQVERSYRQVMSNAGLPEGFWDQSSDFQEWIGGDISPVEVQRRVDEAADAAFRLDQATKDYAFEEFGLLPDDLVVLLLDATRGRDELNRVYRGTRIGGAAAGAGLRLTQQQAQRFGTMAGDRYLEQLDTFANLAATGEKLSGMFGQDYRAEQAAEEVFGASVEAERRRRRLFALEEGEFVPGGGAGRGALAGATGGSY